MTLEFAALMRAMLQGRRGWPIVRLAIALLLVLIGNMVGQVRLNEWNGAFFDALEKRNADAFLLQFIVFSQLIAVLLALVVGQTWLQEMLKVRIRERLSHLLLDDWLQPKRAYRLSLSNERAASTGSTYAGGLPPLLRIYDRPWSRNASIDPPAPDFRGRSLGSLL
jgi:putative ATP-binding cassette transporter